MELEANYRITDQLSGYANYSYKDHKTEGEVAGMPPLFLPLFARNQFNWGVRYKALDEYGVMKDLLLLLDLRYVGTRRSKAGDSVDPFTTVNIGCEFDIASKYFGGQVKPKLRVFIDNLFDERYQEVFGFPMPGITAGGSVKFAMW
jgi:outer membrane receptor protein involved in Fe transport